jgi:hypothetical protein
MNTKLLLSLLTIALLATSCSSTIANQDPRGTLFPTVRGTSLTQDATLLPDAYQGSPVVFLVGYTQRSQFDLDRWILGLTQLKTPVAIVEVPTIPGLLPGMFANKIDDGMRRGIPEEDWQSIVTVYEDGDSILNFLGNERPNNGRIVLLDESSRVLWLWDRGYSATGVTELDKRVRGLLPPGPQ